MREREKERDSGVPVEVGIWKLSRLDRLDLDWIEPPHQTFFSGGKQRFWVGEVCEVCIWVGLDVDECKGLSKERGGRIWAERQLLLGPLGAAYTHLQTHLHSSTSTPK